MRPVPDEIEMREIGEEPGRGQPGPREPLGSVEQPPGGSPQPLPRAKDERRRDADRRKPSEGQKMRRDRPLFADEAAEAVGQLPRQQGPREDRGPAQGPSFRARRLWDRLYFSIPRAAPSKVGDEWPA